MPVRNVPVPIDNPSAKAGHKPGRAFAVGGALCTRCTAKRKHQIAALLRAGGVKEGQGLRPWTPLGPEAPDPRQFKT
jgi:hypothetical protein